jgi:hypothetical protein
MSEMLILQFPDGEREFSYGAIPGVGDRLWKREREWIVASISPDPIRPHPCISLQPVAAKRELTWPFAATWAR